MATLTKVTAEEYESLQCGLEMALLEYTSGASADERDAAKGRMRTAASELSSASCPRIRESKLNFTASLIRRANEILGQPQTPAAKPAERSRIDALPVGGAFRDYHGGVWKRIRHVSLNVYLCRNVADGREDEFAGSAVVERA